MLSLASVNITVVMLRLGRKRHSLWPDKIVEREFVYRVHSLRSHNENLLIKVVAFEMLSRHHGSHPTA